MILRPRSIRLRLTLWFGAALALIVLVFSSVVYAVVRQSLGRQIRGELNQDLVAVARMAWDDPKEIADLEEVGINYYQVSEGGSVMYAARAWQRARLDQALLHHEGRSTITIPSQTVESPNTSPNQKATSSTSSSRGKERNSKKDADENDKEISDDQEKAILEDLSAGIARAPAFFWTSGEQSYCVKAITLIAGNRTFGLAAAQDETPMRRSLHTLALILLIGFPCALFAAMAGGYFLAGRLLAPVGGMASKAQEITAERLSERLPVENPDDELGRLAAAFNATLGRLENAFDRLRRFTADASHELRTPLTAIRSVGEVALQENPDAARCRDVIGSMLEETDRLARLVDSLLVLTRADSGTATLAREPLDLAALVRDVVECLSVLAEEKQAALSVAIEAEPTIAADRATLRQALVNLLDNAVKFTPPGGQVRVRLGRREGEIVVEFADTGPGIAPEHRAKIFERFYRVEDARTRETGGVGLGLAIARWAVEANGGRIEVESEEGRGSTFRIVLPERR